MNVIINDLAWVAICLAVISVFFVICVAFIFLDEGLRRILRKVRQRPAEPPVQTQAGGAPLPAGGKPLKQTTVASGAGKHGCERPSPQILTAARRKLRSKPHTTTQEIHLPFRWGHR